MVDTVRPVGELLFGLFALGQVPGSINEQDVRDMIVSISLETTDLSDLPRSPAGLPLGRLWIDPNTNALSIVTVFQPVNFVDFASLNGSGRLFAQGLKPGTQIWTGSASLGGGGAWLANGTFRAGPFAFGTLPGAGGLLASPSQTTRISTLFGGVGSVTPRPAQRMRATRTIGGAGSFSANGTRVAGVTSSQHWGAHGSVMALSNSNRTLTMDPGDQNAIYCAVGSVFKTSGKWYWEVVVSYPYWQTSVGLGNPSISIEGADTGFGSQLGIDLNSYGIFTNDDDTTHGFGNYDFSQDGNFDLPPVRDNMSIALDCDNWKWWIRLNGGRWNGDMSGTQNPATGAGGLEVPVDLQVGGVAPAISMTGDDGDNVTGNFASSTWNYVAPSGYSAM